jgi:hypothetical protein
VRNFGGDFEFSGVELMHAVSVSGSWRLIAGRLTAVVMWLPVVVNHGTEYSTLNNHCCVQAEISIFSDCTSVGNLR